MTIDEATREFVRKRANYLCEYCHSPERICTTRFTVDHLIPKSLARSDTDGKAEYIQTVMEKARNKQSGQN